MYSTDTYQYIIIIDFLEYKIYSLQQSSSLPHTNFYTISKLNTESDSTIP